MVFNTTAVTRQNLVSSASTLESALLQSWKVGIPSSISHDHHRPLGWALPIALHLRPGLGYLAGKILVPEDTQERETLQKTVRAAFIDRVNKRVNPHRGRFETRFQHQMSANRKFADPDCAAVVDRDLARKIFPEIFEQEDKDGLIPLAGLDVVAPGVFEKDGLLLFAHAFFRRSLSRANTLNEAFLSILDEHRSDGQLSPRIALDSDMIGLADTFRRHIEQVYWWGPKFSNELSTVPTGVSRHESTPRQLYFHGISRTELGWYEQDGKRVFECEELRDSESLGVGSGKFGCRYVHSIVDPASGIATHLDGAVRMYDQDEMIKRLATDIKSAGRNTEYKKLWRLDGNIPVTIWKEMVAHYYRDNRLVGEYLGADEEQPIEFETSTGVEVGPSVYDYVPSHLNPSDGLQISVSYHDSENLLPGCYIRPTSDLLIGDQRVGYLEAESIELIKLLRRSHQAVTVPEIVRWIAFEDCVINFPLVLHSGPPAVTSAQETLLAISKICGSAVDRDIDKVVAFHVGICFDELAAHFSFVGHVQPLTWWLSRPESRLPSTVRGIGGWLDAALREISSAYPKPALPSLWTYLRSNGLLELGRRMVGKEEFDVNATTGAVSSTIAFNPEDLKDAGSNPLSLAEIFEIIASVCTACGQPYELCDCIKSIEDGIAEKVTAGEQLGYFYTNRPS
jgi:hypothetical protein